MYHTSAKNLVKLYLDTSVIIALANPEDAFHDKSLKFIREVSKLKIPITVGDPILLELGKTIKRKGIGAALTVLRTVERHKIELAMLDSSRLLSLVDKYLMKRSL